MTPALVDDPPLVQLDSVSKTFVSRRGWFAHDEVRALDAVSFSIRAGETLGLVGESGSGKSTAGRIIAGLTQASSGTVRVGEHRIETLRGGGRRRLWRQTQMVFQDPYSSLNPRMTVRDILAEPLLNFGIAKGRAADTLVRATLDACGLTKSASGRYPSEFSGGQRQRIAIARALIIRPDFIVADEPTSALDVSFQAQIVNLMLDLKADFGLTYLFISHDLAVVRQMSDHVAVMYGGELVELGRAEQIYTAARHPYTQLLLRSIPDPDPARERRRLQSLPRMTEWADDASKGCPFFRRCPLAVEAICSTIKPVLRQTADGHAAACHYVDAPAVGPAPERAAAAPLGAPSND